MGRPRSAAAPLIVPIRCHHNPEMWLVIHYEDCGHHDAETCLACKELEEELARARRTLDDGEGS
jgi:hypothetical protein